MKLQNIIYPSSNNCQEAELYFRSENDISYDAKTKCLSMKRNEEIVFNTYFNSFSANKWFEYTVINNVYLKINVKGYFLVELLCIKRENGEAISTVMSKTLVDTKGKGQKIDLPFCTEERGGMFAFKITSLEGEGEFYEGGYYTNLGDVKIRNIKIGINICTFKREEFIYKNMKLLEKTFFVGEEKSMDDKLLVYIVDNGKSLEHAKIESEHVKVFPNKNTGGAGGFTRGMIEILREKEETKITHTLLMDDDVVIQPESIFRTYTLLTTIRKEYQEAFIGGAMLRMDEVWIQTESGALWNKGDLVSRKQGLDLRDVEACIYNEVEELCDYNAWWYCVMPIKVIRNDNLPLPIFIRGDDVDYGLRNMEHLILMNGICVWHEPFETKYSSSAYYYIFRNRLIDNAINNINYPKEKFLEDIRQWFQQELFTYRYKNAQLLLNAANDFLKGIEFLKNVDGEKLNTEIIKYGYQMKDANDLEMPVDLEKYRATTNQHEGKIHRFVRKLLLNGMFLTAYDDAIVPMVGPHILFFYRKKRVLNYDETSGKGFVTKKEFKEFTRLIIAYMKFYRLCIKEYDTVVKQYRKRKKELYSLENWKKWLKLT